MAKQEPAKAGEKAKAVAKKRVVKVEAVGEAHINATFNNIIISLTNMSGQVISWSSAGKMGFRGSKKNTPYAAQMAAQDCGKVAFDAGLRKPDASTSANSLVLGNPREDCSSRAQGIARSPPWTKTFHH